jgi:hypothetical protein
MDFIKHEERKTVYNCSLSIRKKLQKDWRDELLVNDILITKSGDLRVIREALYYADGTLRSITLAIRRCSWTKHATTIYERSALKTLGFRKADVKFKPKTHDVDFQEFVASGLNTAPRWMGGQRYDCFSARNFA